MQSSKLSLLIIFTMFFCNIDSNDIANKCYIDLSQEELKTFNEEHPSYGPFGTNSKEKIATKYHVIPFKYKKKYKFIKKGIFYYQFINVVFLI